MHLHKTAKVIKTILQATIPKVYICAKVHNCVKKRYQSCILQCLQKKIKDHFYENMTTKMTQNLLQAMLNSHYKAQSSQEKQREKKHLEKLIIKNPDIKMVPINATLEAIQIIDQSKVFCKQRIPGSGCARKETVDRDILITSRNDERKIMQPIRITSRPPTRTTKRNQLSQFK